MAWYDFMITNDFGDRAVWKEPEWGGHSGIDLGTPNNTPLTLPFSGRVILADYFGGGGRVAVQSANGIIEYFLHLNDIYVQPGQNYRAGSILGTSGGGPGDKILSGNQVIVASSQSQFGDYSSGYHTHFGLVSGSSLNDLFASLGKNVNRIDPIGVLNQLRGGHTPINAGIPGISLDPSSGDNAPVANVHIGSTIHSWGISIGVFLIALVLVVGGFYLLFAEQINQAGKTALKAGEVAAV